MSTDDPDQSKTASIPAQGEAPAGDKDGRERPAEPARKPPEQKPPVQKPGEIGGPAGPEPTRYGDWEIGGRCTDF